MQKHRFEKEALIDWLPPVGSWTGARTLSLGMCPDWELNPQPFCDGQSSNQLSHTSQVRITKFCVHVYAEKSIPVISEISLEYWSNCPLNNHLYLYKSIELGVGNPATATYQVFDPGQSRSLGFGFYLPHRVIMRVKWTYSWECLAYVLALSVSWQCVWYTCYCLVLTTILWSG